MNGVPGSIDSEPTPFPENLEPADAPTTEVHDLDEAIRAQLRSITKADSSEASLYYDASSMAPLSPISAVSSLLVLTASDLG